MSAESLAHPPSPLWLAVKVGVFSLVAPGTLAAWLPRWLAGNAPPASPWLRWASAAPFAAGLATYIWCVWDFASFGKGTPAPIDAPRFLVVRGLYRYVRNPMYLGVLLVIAGWALWYGDWGLAGYGAVVALGFHAFVRLVEEPSLGSRFHPAYQRYCATVPRWLPRKPHS